MVDERGDGGLTASITPQILGRAWVVQNDQDVLFLAHKNDKKKELESVISLLGGESCSYRVAVIERVSRFRAGRQRWSFLGRPWWHLIG